MSTPTTLVPPSISLLQNLKRGSSPNERHKNCAPRSTSDPTPPMKTNLSPLLLNKRWKECNYSFQNSKRSQCPHVHHHPWCDDCQTLMEWEPPLPTRLTCVKWILTFGDLKMVVQVRSCCQSPSAYQSTMPKSLKKVCSMWREEQFAKAVAKRCGWMAAREAVCQTAHQQCAACGVRPLA